MTNEAGSSKTFRQERKLRTQQQTREQKKAESPSVAKVLSGKISQHNKDFGFAPACLPNSLVAICHPVDPELWTPRDVDLMLKIGFDKYKEAISKSTYEMGEHLGHFDSHLMGNGIAMEGKNIRFEINSSNRQGRLTLSPYEVEDETFCSLATALAGVTLNRSAILLATTEAMWVGIRVSSAGRYIVSNPHPVTKKNGFDIKNGVARVFFCNDVQSAVGVIKAMFHAGDDGAYHLHYVQIFPSN